jgi:hypothetical protein
MFFSSMRAADSFLAREFATLRYVSKKQGLNREQVEVVKRRTPEQADDADNYETQVWRDESKVDYLRRDEDAPRKGMKTKSGLHRTKSANQLRSKVGT